MSAFPKQCCATGSLHTGTPKGSVGKLHGLDCYTAEAPPGTQSKGIVVIIPDIWGWKLPNSRILADEYASKGGFTVYLPDFQNGYVIPPDLILSIEAFHAKGLVANLKKVYHFGVMLYWGIPFFWYNSRKTVKPQIHSFFKALRANEASNLPVGVAGFCWGGYWTAELCSDATKTDDGKRLIDCGFTAHPSGLSVPADIEKVTLPLSIAAASIDQQLPKAQADTVKAILGAKAAKGKDDGVDHELVWYEGANHGFAVRASEKDVEEAERGKQAEKQAIDWFSRWFAAYK